MSTTISETQTISGGTIVGASEIPEITFTRPLPGFENLTKFALVRSGAGGETSPADATETVFYELRSLEDPNTAFVVAIPNAFFSGYSFELEDELCDELEIAGQGEALVLTVLTLTSAAGHATANLMAPIVINSRTRMAAQVILSGGNWPSRADIL